MTHKQRPVAQRYAFDTLFKYYPESDVIMPLYTVTINGEIFKADVPIRKNDMPGGIDLHSRISQDLAGKWDSEHKLVEITGFY
jgi:hypothetical protein